LEPSGLTSIHPGHWLTHVVEGFYMRALHGLVMLSKHFLFHQAGVPLSFSPEPFSQFRVVSHFDFYPVPN